MKLALALVLVVACNKSEKKAEPAPVTKEGSAMTEGSAAKEAPKPEAAKCEIKVMITADALTFDGAVKGTTPYTRGDKVDLSALAPHKGKCEVNIKGDAAASYQDVIQVMDQVVMAGLPDLSIGDEYKGTAKKPPPPKASSNDLGIKGEWKPDGTLVAQVDPNAGKDALKNAIVIILTTKEAKVGEKVVAPVDDPDLAAKIATAIGEPKENLAILQADQGLSYAIIARAIEGAQRTGVDNVLFAVKNR